MFYIQIFMLFWDIVHLIIFLTVTSTEGTHLPQACKDITSATSSNGIYTIYPAGEVKGIDVPCDMTTDGGGWTVITNRKNGHMDFNRSWTEYKNGFGSPDDSYWIGNTYIHALTAGKNTEVYFDLDFVNGSSRYAKYKNFTIGSEAEKFKITYDGASYTGNAGNALYGSADSRYYPARMYFTTYDRDNDRNPYGNCAAGWGGGWWFNYCHQTCLTGTPGTTGYQWHGVGSGSIYSLAASRIMIR